MRSLDSLDALFICRFFLFVDPFEDYGAGKALPWQSLSGNNQAFWNLGKNSFINVHIKSGFMAKEHQGALLAAIFRSFTLCFLKKRQSIAMGL